MANPGVGGKFVSVNLNKSYGQRPSVSGNSGTSRSRSGGDHGGGSGGMVVLSRFRSSVAQKSGFKLSIPPPLNLPSLRKEHERLDSSSGAGSAGAGGAGAGGRPSSAGIGWTKRSAPSPLHETDSGSGGGNHLFGATEVGSQRVDEGDPSSHSSNGVTRGSSIYVPPSARSGPIRATVAGPSVDFPPVVKAVVLRGEDFPSLQATLPTASGPAQKQKDTLHRKQNRKASEDASEEQMGDSYLRPSLGLNLQNLSSHSSVGSSRDENGKISGGSMKTGQFRKQDEFFPSPLPLVRLNHKSDWADDERDVRHAIPDREREHGYSRNESPWGRDFDVPRGGAAPPRTSVHGPSDARSLREEEAGRPSSRDIARSNLYNRDGRAPSREGRAGNSWKVSSLVKDGLSAWDTEFDRTGVNTRPLSLNEDTNRERKHNQFSFGDNGWDNFKSGVNGSQESRFGKRDMIYGQGSRQNGNHAGESFSGRRAEQNKLDHYGGDHSNRYRGDFFQNSLVPKASFSFGGKGTPVIDPILNFGRERRSTSGKQYLEDPFLKDFGSGLGFDGRDPFSGSLAGVMKKKKDVLKQTDFHDPVRESFEAELDRVQKFQEQERQRALEEQARAFELARKEEEERERLAREEEERRRRLEEEAREAAWRADQERLEVVRLAEEQRMAREEEKRRIFLEEERRKEAARQKLLELEARIERRQAEETKGDKFPATARDGRMLGAVKELDIPRVAEVVDWEDGERMVERITSSASSESSGLNRSFETGSRPQFYRNGDYAFPDRKLANSWKRDVFENGSSSSFHLQDQENGYRSPRRDVIGAGRTFTRKEFYESPGIISARTYPEPHQVNDFPHPRGHRWNPTADADDYSRTSEVDPEFHDNLTEKFNDMGWGNGRSRSSPYGCYPERIYQNPEMDGLSSFGRSRYSMRQPRVLPPPSLSSMHKSNFKTDMEHPHSSAFLDSGMSYHQAPRKSESNMQTAYDGGFQEREQSRMMDVQQENTIPQSQKGDKNTTSRCDSQSSLSVSSAPSSPTHLSHDDIEDSSYSPVLAPAAEGEEIPLSDDDIMSIAVAGNTSKVSSPRSVSPVEDEEWTIDDNQELPEQEEYDEEENGYREEDELHEGDDEHIEPQEFEDLHLEEKDSSGKMCQQVLGFNEGVEVGITSGDDFQRLSGNGEKMIGKQQVLDNGLEEQESFDDLVDVGQNLQSENISSEIGMEASKNVLETDKAHADLVIHDLSVSHSSSTASAGYLLNSVESSSTPGPLSQQPFTPVNMDLPSSTGQPIMSSVSSGSSQAEAPAKLQFGLFSGPSLIPSPIPAIQIGSIQMPLHLHPQVGPSLTQIHPSQPPFFQFGQVRYASPISQGILPLAPQSMSFVQPSVPVHYSLNQNHEGYTHNQPALDTSIQGRLVKDNVSSVQTGNQPCLPQCMDQSKDTHEVNILPITQGEDNEVLRLQSHDQHSLIGETRNGSGLISHDGRGHNHLDIKKNPRSVANFDESQGQTKAEHTTPRFISKAPGTFTGSRGKRFIYTVKKAGSRQLNPVSESPSTDTSGYQGRTRQKFRLNEFRVRENLDKRQTEGLVSSNSGPDEKSNFNGRVTGKSFQRVRKDAVPNKTSKQKVESDSLNSDSISSGVVSSERKIEKQFGKEVPTKKLTSAINIPHSGEVNPKRNSSSEEDVDAPLQSGVVRVFKQSGIETLSDEDDFIEVRSKRQMLNDRREQREKEIKAKSRVIKAPRKRRSVSQNIMNSANSTKSLTSLRGEAANNFHSKSGVTEGRGSLNSESSTGFTTGVASQPLAPIGTPAITIDATEKRSQATRSLQTGFVPVMNNDGTNHLPGVLLENKTVVLDNVSTPLSHWGNVQTNQQVMALTLSQFDEAMNPARFDTLAVSIDHTSAVIEPNKPSASIMTQDKSLSSSPSPLNSLLAGETIQFGAVTSPPILPPSSHAVSKGLGPPGSCRSDASVDHKLSAIESDCPLFFEKEKHPSESCVHLEDPEAEAEAEAEAAASAVAVAAISSDEIVGNGLGASISVLDTKSFGGGENEELDSEGGIGSHQLTSQSRGEESLSVALPADLSVETPSLSLWPPLPSPQNSSGQMLSHFPGAPPSHFPCYDMNPMLGAPIFAFSPHNESAGTQSQTLDSRPSSSGQLGAWQQCHSGIDSFYGPSAGFTGPFISPSGGIPGVQGPPHMVVYNHFAPVAQFGQVGLSFMGATYIPSGKQPDWKHNSASSAAGIGEGDINNLNIASAQRNTHSMPAPVQHLAPGSPLLPLASPLTMFDMSPFQSSTDIPVQARWPHVPASPLHSVPLSLPLQQQEVGLSSQFNHGSSVDQSTGNMFREPHSSATQDGGRNLPVVADGSASQFPDELGLVDPSSNPTSRVLTNKPTLYSSTVGTGRSQSIVTKSLSKSTGVNSVESGLQGNSTSSGQAMSSALQTQSQHQGSSTQQQYIHHFGLTDHRVVGVHHKMGSGGEWSHRGKGFHGRNQSSGSDKKLAPAKMKQVYVAKTTRSQT